MTKSHVKIYGVIITVFLLPLISFAQVSEVACSKIGYTVATINGIFTKEGDPGGDDGAEANRIAVKRLLLPTYKGEKLTLKYLYNPTHGLFGVIDLSDVAIQKTFEGVDMGDPDFLKMLNDASTQVKTQKLLLVAHSQGNFYANNIYETVTSDGDVSKKSIGVYSVATPASYVAGNGLYRTSNTDTVINLARNVLPGTFLPAHDSIDYLDSDDSGKGHDFREIYLQYRGEEIKKEIEASLDKLSADPTRSENVPCINPPKALSAFEDVTGPVAYSADFAIATGAVGLTAIRNGINYVNLAISNAENRFFFAIGTTLFSFVISPADATNNNAAVILATQTTQPQTQTQTQGSVPVKNQEVTVANPAAQPQTTSVTTSQKPQAVFVFEPKVQTGTNVPKLVFVGTFMGGTVPQVLGSMTSGAAEVLKEDTLSDEVAVLDSTGVALAAPALSAPRCTQTLASDGCLIATTTIRFEWAAIPGADHYFINKNGINATTTDTTFETTIKDFSDYTFEIVAVDADGHESATSTQAVSVATIPIAINEIAWMGTIASASDEWFEIKNNTGHTIDLSQWELNTKDGTPHVKLTGTISPHAYLVFERTDNTTIADITAHQIYTGALGNAGEQLNLSFASTTFDQTPDGAWAAGYNSTTSKQTMERYSSREPGDDPTNWGTNLGYIKNGTDADGNAIDGTPGAQNSVSTLINKGQDITGDFTLTADEERYVVPGQLLISASSTLTIEPGVEIKFYDGWISTQGHLVVAGTQENPVTIGAFSGNQDGGISVGGGYTDTSYQGMDASATLDHVNIENINYISAYDNAHLAISNTDLSGSSGGIYALDTAQISIASSSIRNTQDNHAVAGYENSQITIASSTITNTLGNDAVGVYGGTTTITNTTIDGVPDDGGISVSGGTLLISSSTIKNVSDYGISIYKATSTISNVKIENVGYVGVDIYYGQATVASTTISGVAGWAGISVDEGTLSISSSTIKNVSDYGIATYKATSTISNVVVENGGGPGIDVYQGKAMITDTTVSGFGGSGISVYDPTEPVVITGGEVTGNAMGIDMEAGSAIITPDVSVHDNGTGEADNIVVW